LDEKTAFILGAAEGIFLTVAALRWVFAQGGLLEKAVNKYEEDILDEMHQGAFRIRRGK
jgi:hypothetical protein